MTEAKFLAGVKDTSGNAVKVQVTYDLNGKLYVFIGYADSNLTILDSENAVAVADFILRA